MTVKLAWRAVQMFENDRDELGGDCSYEPVGCMVLLEEGSAASGLHTLELERQHGVEVREISPEDILELAPHFNLEGVTGAIYEPRSGYADPVRTTVNLVERAKEWGLVVHEGVAATGIRLDGDRVSGVETEEGTIDTPVVVNAAGPWGRQVGLWVGKNYSIRWSRESDLMLRLPPDFGVFPITSDRILRQYFRPQGDGQVMAGLGAPKDVEPLDIDNYDEGLDPSTRERIEHSLFQRVPALRGADYVGGWASLYTITDDWHPIVGPELDLGGYYVCFAGSGHGFKLAPSIGEALADTIAGDDPWINLHELRPSRFIEGEPVTTAWGSGNLG